MSELEPFWCILFDLGALRRACRNLQASNIDIDVLTGIANNEGSCYDRSVLYCSREG
jgi:hypothetical protein